MSRDNNSISSKMYSAGAYSNVSCLFFYFFHIFGTFAFGMLPLHQSLLPGLRNSLIDFIQSLSNTPCYLLGPELGLELKLRFELGLEFGSEFGFPVCCLHLEKE